MIHTSKVYYGGKLIAKTLAERGCCLEEDIFALQSCSDDFTLQWSVIDVNSVPLVKVHCIPKTWLLEYSLESEVYISVGPLSLDRHCGQGIFGF